MTIASIWRALPPAAVAVLALAVMLPFPAGHARAERTAEGSIVGNYLAGRFAHGQRDLAAASDFMSRALSGDPDNEVLAHQAFLLSVGAGRMTEAMALARRVVEGKPKHPIANYVLAAERLRAGDLAAAAARLDKVSRDNLNRFLAPLLIAWVQLAQGETEAALATVETISEVRAFDVLRHLHLGLMNELAGNTVAAEDAFARAATSIGRAPFRVVQAVGGFYERQGRLDEARAIYQQYAEDTPESYAMATIIDRMERGEPVPPLVSSPIEGVAEAFYHMAGTLQQDQVSELALIYGRIALYLREDFPVAGILLGRTLEVQGRHREAIEMYRGVAADSPFGWPARLRIASSHQALDEVDAAERLLRAMAAEMPERPDALLQLGQLLRAEERFAEAVEAYDGAIARLGEIESRHWTLFYFRGIALERSEQWPRAEKDFLRALELQPEEPYVLNYLGYSWVDRGENLDKGREMLLRAVELRPEDGYIVDSLGWVYYRLGRYQDAVKQLERAVELRPQDPVINDHLGDAYWHVGRRREARFQWRHSLALDPEPKLVPEIERKLAQGLVDAAGKGGD
jgi:tetratricopeptide (TPR) repeat protein